MKVNYYFRNAGPGNYSLENVFNAVMDVLRHRIELEIYKTRKPLDAISVWRFRKLKADIHHITGAVNYLAFGLPSSNLIITVHDIGHYTKTLSGIKRILYKYLFWSFPLRSAKKITAISDFTREQLIHHFRINPDKIVVIPNPVDPTFQYVPPRVNKSPLILQIGSGKNKNIENLMLAVRGLDVKLLLVRPPEDSLIRTLNDFKIPYEFRGDLSQKDLAKAYADADMVYFASTYEGFGLPVLEAMAVGRPVITSAISPLKEIARDAALLVDPNSAIEIKEAICRLISSSSLRFNLVEKGKAVLNNYQVDKIADQYYSLYNEILKSNE